MTKAVKLHKVLLCANERDYLGAVQRRPDMADWTPIYRESQLYGLWISEWAITERAAHNMRHLDRMANYLEKRASLTRLAHPN